MLNVNFLNKKLDVDTYGVGNATENTNDNEI